MDLYCKSFSYKKEDLHLVEIPLSDVVFHYFDGFNSCSNSVLTIFAMSLWESSFRSSTSLSFSHTLM